MLRVMRSRLSVMSLAFLMGPLAYSVMPLLPHHTSSVVSNPSPASSAQVVIVALPPGPCPRAWIRYDGVHGVVGSASAQGSGMPKIAPLPSVALGSITPNSLTWVARQVSQRASTTSFSPLVLLQR